MNAKILKLCTLALVVFGLAGCSGDAITGSEAGAPSAASTEVQGRVGQAAPVEGTSTINAMGVEAIGAPEKLAASSAYVEITEPDNGDSFPATNSNNTASVSLDFDWAWGSGGPPNGTYTARFYCYIDGVQQSYCATSKTLGVGSHTYRVDFYAALLTGQEIFMDSDQVSFSVYQQSTPLSVSIRTARYCSWIGGGNWVGVAEAEGGNGSYTYAWYRKPIFGMLWEYTGSGDTTVQPWGYQIKVIVNSGGQQAEAFSASQCR